MSQEPLPGVIDSLGGGFSVVNRRLWLAALPLILDLVLWLSPPVTAGPLAERAISSVERTVEQAAGQRPLDEQQRQQSQEQWAQFQAQAKAINLLDLVTWYLPSLAGSIQAAGDIGAAAPAEIESWGALGGIVLGLALAGFLAVALFLGPLAQAVRDGRNRLGELRRELLPATARFGGYVMLVGALFLLVGITLALFIAILAAVAAPLAALVVFLATALAIWALLYLSLADKALFLSRSSPAEAIRRSMSLVKGHFWPALGLFVLVNLILQGTPLAWRLITGHPVGALVAMVGNAYIGTGVLAGTFVFYRDRAAIPGVPASERSG